jgi:hypothetical protein
MSAAANPAARPQSTARPRERRARRPLAALRRRQTRMARGLLRLSKLHLRLTPTVIPGPARSWPPERIRPRPRVSGGKICSLGHGLNAGDANRRVVMVSLSVTVTFIVTVATDRDRDRVMGLPADRPELSLSRLQLTRSPGRVTGTQA